MNPADLGRRIADGVLEASVVGSFSRLGYAARRSLFEWDAEPDVDLAGRVVVVTGATGGLGLAAAHALAARQAEVWMVGRDPARTDAARDRVLGAVPGARVCTAVADLARLADVRGLAERLESETVRLDVLVHNAGALSHELRTTEDGLEVTAQVHVVAPFLLTQLLYPRLRSTGGARVITVSSGGMYTQPLDLAALAAPPAPFNGSRTYANAKRAQVVLNAQWARRCAGDGVVFHAMHPGWADTPGVREALPRFRAVMRPLLRTPHEGADTIVWLASAAPSAQSSGAFWLDRRRRMTNRIPWTRTSDHDAERLWEWCADHAGVGALPNGVR